MLCDIYEVRQYGGAAGSVSPSHISRVDLEPRLLSVCGVSCGVHLLPETCM